MLMITTLFVAAVTLAGWLPSISPQFTPWGDPHTSYTRQRDGFVCPGPATAPPSASPTGFEYPMSRCAALRAGTPFSFGSGEPQRGAALYDPAHGLALYYSGCCAARQFVLAGGVAQRPPIAIRNADLSGVKTQRGVALGMTVDALERIYGKATAYVPAGSGGATVLTYSSFSRDPVHASDETCGQYQSFAFRNGKLALIEIYAGC